MNCKGYERKLSSNNSKYFPGIFLEGLKETGITLARISAVPADIQTRRLLNTNRKCQHLTQLA
jgi:hypothetical protein